MSNAQQSSTYGEGGCSMLLNICTAEKALDDNLDTFIHTSNAHSSPWWMAELEKIVNIVNIFVYVREYQFVRGSYDNFKVETGVYNTFYTIFSGID